MLPDLRRLNDSWQAERGRAPPWLGIVNGARDLGESGCLERLWLLALWFNVALDAGLVASRAGSWRLNELGLNS